jgi:anaerobic selenocysteine-containing dehydrogenase
LNQLQENEFHLLSVRSEGQFNTVVYEEEDLYRGQERRDVVMMNKEDMMHMGLIKDDLVAVKSETGQIDNMLARPFDIKRGTVLMYYPEANALISQKVDPMSRTPGFKSAIVSVGLS